MIDKAIAHITKQMMELNQPLVQAIEEHLTSICTTDAVAGKLLQEEKTLKELNDKIWNKARRQQKKGCAFLREEEVYGIAEDYYEIAEADKKTETKNDVIDIMDLL